MRLRAVYRSVALLRIADLGSRPSGVRAALHDRLAVLAGNALEEARVPPDRCRTYPGQDHLLVVADHSPVGMVTDFVRALDEYLRESEAGYRPEHALRLVVAIDHGLVGSRDGSRDSYPADEVVARCHRLAREAAPPAALVVLVTDELHRAVVRQGHRGIDPSSYARLAGGGAWVRVLGVPAAPSAVPAAPAPAGGRQVSLSDAREMLRALGEPDD